MYITTGMYKIGLNAKIEDESIQISVSKRYSKHYNIKELKNIKFLKQ